MLRYLLDTNVVIRRLTEPKKLSREQTRILDDLERNGQPFAVSAITLLEIAVLLGDRSGRIKGDVGQILDALDHPLCRIVPLAFEVAAEVAAIGGTLRDPADRTIVATARVHRLKLLTSDERIIDSGLVAVID
ncbi:MAG: PIN domain-containing protein [Bryobacteraceae bacterium]